MPRGHSRSTRTRVPASGCVRRTRAALGRWGCRPLLASPWYRCCYWWSIRFPCTVGPLGLSGGHGFPHRGQVGGGSSPMNSPQPGQTSWSQHTGSPTTSRTSGGACAGGPGHWTGGLAGSAGTVSASASVLPALTAVGSLCGWSVMFMSFLVLSSRDVVLLLGVPVPSRSRGGGQQGSERDERRDLEAFQADVGQVESRGGGG